MMFLLVHGSLSAQDNRTLETKVADILAQFPTNDTKHCDRLMNELYHLGNAGFIEVTKLITPTGVGDDTQARFAINSYARYCSDFGRNDEKLLGEKAMLDAFNKTSNKGVKAFYVHQLKLIGGNASITALASSINDDRLCEPISQLFVTIGTPEAEKVFIENLSGASKKNKVTFIQALGALKVKSAAKDIAKVSSSSDKKLRKASLLALANIGSADSYDVLLSAAKGNDFKYDEFNSAGAFITYADKLGENENFDLCKKACNDIIALNTEADLLHNKASALKIIAKYFGHEATPILIKEIDNADKAYRGAILNVAQNSGDVSCIRKWIAKAESSPANIKAEIITMFGNRKACSATSFVASCTSDQSKAVREAALKSLVSIKGSEANTTLLAQLKKGGDNKYVGKLLKYNISSKHLTPFVNELNTLSSDAKVVVINTIAAKSAKQYFNTVFSYTSSKDAAVKTAAFNALQKVSTPKGLNKLIDLLLKTKNANETSLLQKSIISAAKQRRNDNAKTKELLAVLSKTKKKDKIVAILPQLGGSNALRAVKDLFAKKRTKKVAFAALVDWKDNSASRVLYDICNSKKGKKYRPQAFKGFVKQISKSNLPADQKLLKYKKIMPFASNNDDKKLIIKQLNNTKTFLALLYAAKFMDTPELQREASYAVMKIALPSSGKKDGMSGDLVKKILTKAIEVISGPDSNYYKINMRNHIAKMEKGPGYVSMFNGKDLSGWKGLVGNPIKRAKMSASELAEKQKEADKKMHENWSVKDGSIVFNGHGANLCSDKDYKDFEMICDWRITDKGDSGIYLRGTPQIQIWDTSRVKVGADVGSGGLYNNKKHISKPLKLADNAIGEWNTFRIKMVDEKVTVYLNGVLVVDNVTMDNYWDRKQPIFRTGAIELQAHGTDLAFRNIYVKEVKDSDYNLSEAEKKEGFQSLFNGKDLNRWQGNKKDYRVEDGMIVIRPKQGGHGNLYTDKEYKDFHYKFEFQLTPGANNGLGIRTPLKGDAAYVGMELQILDNTAPIYANLKPYQYHGSVYGVISAKRGFLKPVGEWNKEEVIIKGSKIKIILNGTTIVDGDIKEASKKGTLDKKNHPGLKREKGYIGFLGHGSVVKFRNIRIKELK